MKLHFILVFFLCFLVGASVDGFAQYPPSNSSEIQYDQIIFVDEVSSLKELFEQFKGEVVYINVWASFCKPSLEPFNYCKELQSFFYPNRIVSVYISMDGVPQREQWHSLVKEKSLKGYHVSMSENGNLSKDILNLLCNEEGKMDMSIPRYLIMDRSGKLVNRNAHSPREKKGLIKQLSPYLK